MTALSKNAMELLTIASGSPEGPGRLWNAWQAGDLTPSDLHAVIPQVWAYTDWPECAIGADRWTALFRATGFIAVPTTLTAPIAPLILYRGSSEKRSLDMAWSQVATKASQFQESEIRHQPALRPQVPQHCLFNVAGLPPSGERHHVNC